ncbi:MAG: cupin domain-containing protein [Rhodospirillales bacterium]|nr:cupin domain-containing protein [Rhodospirillales bacterium]
MTAVRLQAMVQHADESLFENRGLRDYFSYRDLGVADASDGRIVAQINRANYQLTEEGELHHHVLTHQINLVLQGTAVMKFEGTGEVHLATGTCFYMPPNIKHTFVSCSDDFITMEICTPADFGTVEDDPATYSPSTRLPQAFSMQTAEQGDFAVQGLRTYLSYRDLGIVDATGGAILAHIIRAEGGAYAGSGEWHFHVLNDQFVYVLQGWAEVQFEGEKPIRVDAGTCFYQPSEIRHAFLACSADFQALEVCLPAEFETVTA